MIRLIVSDMDGTLLSTHEDVHPENLSALRQAMARGIRFAVASGRSALSCSRILQNAGLMDAGILAVNGGQIMDRPYGKIIWQRTMDPDTARETARILRGKGLDFCIYTEDALVYDTREAFEKYEGPVVIRKTAAPSLRKAYGAEAVEAALNGPVLKLYTGEGDIPEENAAFQAARAACAALPGAEITSSSLRNFEVMPRGVNKGTTLAVYAEMLGIEQAEVMAFGDNENDLEMLLWAGCGIAVGNARDSVLRAVPRHTGHYMDAGVARAIAAHCGLE